ncbi:MAG: PepSY domain-containing protein [Clostridiales bacterium]|nr:PepSY domain-containing protein [Clostridiales bacterium]
MSVSMTACNITINAPSADESSATSEASQTDDASGASEASSAESASSDGYIGIEEAEKIALEHAGVDEADTIYLNSHLEYEDGAAVYDVEFYDGSKEYSYEIDAATGSITSYDYDIEDYSPTVSNSSIEVSVDLETAKSAAFDDAGLTEDQVTQLKAYLDRDDGQYVYEISFVYNELEYEYEINADTGSVISADRESVYD